MSSSGTLNELTEPLLLLDMQKYSSALVVYTQSRQPFYQQAHYSESNSTAPSYITKAQASDRRMRMAAFTVCRGWMHFIYQWLHWCNSGIASFFFFTKTLFQITVRGRHNMDDRLDYETFHLLKTVFFFFLCFGPTSGLSHVSAFRADIHHKAMETAFPNSVRHSLTHGVKKETCQCLFLHFFFCIRPTLCVFYHNLSFYVTGRSSESDC